MSETGATPRASVIVRARNEAAAIERCLASLRAQTVPVEIVVVDSGSTDGTLEIARRHADQLIEIRPEDFTFGRALNLGAAAAQAPFHFALSSHCYAPLDDWVERSLAHYDEPKVAATNGATALFDGSPLFTVFRQRAEHAHHDPYWGYSNHAGSWRAEVWQRHRFNETIEACEDKEWAWRVLNDGWEIAFEPALSIPSTHRRGAGARSLYRRMRKEARATVQFAELEPTSLRQAVGEWWNGFPENGYPPFINRVNYYRIAEIAGRYVGQREQRGSR